jgi:hypothetical protein
VAYGNYDAPSSYARWGYHIGTGASMAASLLYGGLQLRIAKGAITTAREGFHFARSLTSLINESKTLTRARTITPVTTQNTPLKHIFEQATLPTKVAAEVKIQIRPDFVVGLAVSQSQPIGEFLRKVFKMQALLHLILVHPEEDMFYQTEILYESWNLTSMLP